MNKASIVMFLNEILLKTIREYQSDQAMFEFITFWLNDLNDQEKLNPDFHLIFLIELTKHLGLYPQGEHSNTNRYFDLYESCYCDSEPVHGHFITPPLAELFGKLMMSSPNDQVTKTKKDRQLLLDYLLDYYRLHLDNFEEVKSREILEVVLQ